MNEQDNGRASKFGRKMTDKYERKLGEKRLHRSFAEKLRKYEGRAEGYEFVPAMMHLLRRYLDSDLPTDQKNAIDKRLQKALDQIPNAKEIMQVALSNHDNIPNELKARIFSPKYLALEITQGIDVSEVSNIMQRATMLQNTSIRSQYSMSARTGDFFSNYGNCCCCCHTPNMPSPHPEPPPIAPPKQYEITFEKLYCVDESDPEWGFSDEPYVVFGIINEEMAEIGTSAWAISTPKYEDIDDGETAPASGAQMLRLFGAAGAKDISSTILITASCFEHDFGNITKITDAVRAGLTAAATKAASAGGTVGWLIAGASVISIAVSYIVDLWADDDQISSTMSQTVTEAEADAKTSSVNPSWFNPLFFFGGDDDGAYDVHLLLRRV